jgi:TolA-binding protein
MMRRTVKAFLPVHPCCARWIGCLAALSFFFFFALGARAASAEARAYEAAVRLYDGAAFDLAEAELANFVKNYPDSENVAQAILLQAQSRFRQGKYDAALALLRERSNNAIKLADQYRYWIAECLYKKGDYAGAAAAFAQILSDFPDSSRRLNASLGEAYARFKLGDLKRTVELITQPAGAFQQAALKRTDDTVFVRGLLLLGETYLQLKEYRAGEEVMDRLAERNLPPEPAWQRLYLLALLQMADRRSDSALQTMTNLLGQLTAVTNTLAASLKADAVALQGELLESKNLPEEAMKAYETNLSTNTPIARRQQALQQILKLTLAQGRLGEAGVRLEAYTIQNPGDSSLDLLRLTLGELRLKEYYALPEENRKGAVNLLQQARGQLERIIAHTNAQFSGQAQLNRGWCLWEEAQAGGATNQADSLVAFRTATQSLPRSDDQAVARFKWADCQFASADFAGASTNYWLVATNYADLPRVQNELVGHALYQIVRSSIQSGDLEGANQAIEKILAEYPSGNLNERSLLLYGQALNRLGSPAAAREFFDRFVQRFAESPWRPEVELAVARTYEQEGAWKEASQLYEQWLTRNADHPARPEAEFNRAWAEDLARNEAKAFELFTNFVTQFPTNKLAPQAQYWVAAYYYCLGGTNYDKADENFQNVYQNTNWPPSEFSFEARMMAGRAAYMRQGYKDAYNYFTNLIDKLITLNRASPLIPQAYYALADTYTSSAGAVLGLTNALDGYKAAIGVLDKITREYPTNALAPLAWGQMGMCYLQLASVDTNNYERAAHAFTNALKSELANVKCRSIAEVGLARVLEKQAEQASTAERTNLLKEALRHYWNVVDGQVLRESETADPVWLKVAATAAASLAEELQRWDEAGNLYQKLAKWAPPLRKTWESKLERLEQLRSQLGSPKN